MGWIIKEDDSKRHQCELPDDGDQYSIWECDECHLRWIKARYAHVLGLLPYLKWEPYYG